MTIKALILAEGGEEIAYADQVRASGGWVIGTARPIASALTAADDRPDIIIADLHALDAAKAESVLERLAVAGRTAGLIVKIGVEQIDLATSFLDGPEALLLADPDPIDLAAAISAALGVKAAQGVRETDRLPGLRELSEETGRIARALAEHAQAYHPAPQPALTHSAAPRPVSATAVRQLIRKRRLRDRFFAAQIFADPAWDMLLDLYAARLEGRRIAVSSLCIAAHVPPSTALRWIQELTNQGLLVRMADPSDRRRIFIALSDGAAERMEAYFALSED